MNAANWKQSAYARAFIYEQCPHFHTNTTAILTADHLVALLLAWDKNKRKAAVERLRAMRTKTKSKKPKITR